MQPIRYQKRTFAVEGHTWKEACLEDSEQNTTDHKTRKRLSDALTDGDDT